MRGTIDCTASTIRDTKTTAERIKYLRKTGHNIIQQHNLSSTVAQIYRKAYRCQVFIILVGTFTNQIF